MALFKAREIRQGATEDELRRQLNEAFRAIERDLSSALASPKVSEVITASNYNPTFGEVVRVAPPSTGLRIALPEPNLARLDARVTVVQEAASGALSVEVVNGTINGGATLSYLAGIGTVEFILTPTGWYGWSVSLVNDLPLTALADQAAETLLGNFTASSAPPTARAGTSVAGAGLTYTAGGTLAVGDGFAITVNADDIAVTTSDLRGIGLTVTAAGALQPRQRPRAPQIRDYLLSGNAATGTIGALGWNLLGTGTPAYARGNPTVMGATTRGALTTSAGANDRSVLTLGETETRDVVPASEVTILQCAWNHDNVLTNKRIFFGLMGTFATEPATAVDCLGIYYDSAVDTHYQIIARASSVGSATITTLVVPANTGELMTIYQSAAGTYSFYSGNTLLGTISSGVPTAAMNVGWRLETLTTAAKTVNLGYFGFEATAANTYDDDAFLEA